MAVHTARLFQGDILLYAPTTEPGDDLIEGIYIRQALQQALNMALCSFCRRSGGARSRHFILSCRNRRSVEHSLASRRLGGRAAGRGR